MEGALRQPPQAVLVAYGCPGARVTTENVKARKAVWYIERPGTPWVLKRSPLSEGRLRFVLAAADHLRSRGIRLPPPVLTEDGRPYVAVPEGLFFMTERVEGSTPSYEEPAERTRILEGLARFHRASEGFDPSRFPDAHVQLGMWPHQYRKRLQLLAEAGGSGPFWSAAAPEHARFVEAARTALERLQQSAYHDWVERTRRRGGLCHQDFAAGNLLMQPSGELTVLDLDSTSVEIPARDLRKILFKVLKKRGTWDDGLARSMLADYHRVNPLAPEEYEVLHADLLFPHLYHGLISKYVAGRAPEWDRQKFVSRLRAVMAFERSKWEALAGTGVLFPQELPTQARPGGGDH